MDDDHIQIESLKQAVVAGTLIWSRHALERILKRGISRAQVLDALITGEIIEEYPQDYPWPSALFLGWNGDQPLHVVAALNPEENMVAIITAYQPDEGRFGPDFKTRRTP